jgi:hypothetical protein
MAESTTGTSSSTSSDISLLDMDGTSTSPPVKNVPNAVGVGLSDPEVSKARRQMLDLVNRLESTGWVMAEYYRALLILTIGWL